MDKMLKIYYGDGTPFPNADLQAELYSFQYDCKRMGTAPTITATVMYPTCLDDLWNDNVYVRFRGEKYHIDLKPSSSYSNTDARYKHELTFVSERRILETKIFTDGVLTEFHFFGDLNMLVTRLNDFFIKERMTYSVVADAGITTEEKDVDIKNMYVNDVLLHGFELFNIPYYFKGKEVHFGYYENEIDEVFEYGVVNALLSVNKENSNNKVITRITGVGSSENIPYYYPNFNESGEHDVTTTPSGYQNQISKLNYLKIDPYTNLRNGGWAKYHKACVNPIGDDTERFILKVTNETSSYEKEVEGFSIDGNFLPRTSYFIENGYNYYYDDNIYAQVEIHTRDVGYKEISNILKIKYAGEPSYTNIQASDILEVKGIYTSSSSVDGFFGGDVEENLSYSSYDTYIRIFPTRMYHTIRVKLKFPLRGQDYILNPNLTTYNCSFLYDTNYFNSQRNLTVGSAHFYNDYNKIMNFTNGINSYDASYVYAVTREVAGYSTVYLDTIFRGMFLDASDKGLTEWYKFTPSSVVIKDSDGNDVTEQWWDSVNEYIHFRNTSDQRKVYTITMTVSVNMTTPENTTAYGVQLYYDPDFERYEFNYDYWKFHDGKPQQKYSVFGVKFTDTSIIPDCLVVNFSETKNWIDPKQYLMPKVYRDTLGQNIWYDAINGTHMDEHGIGITFANQYNPNNPKEHISDPKDDIKPTIVWVTNANGERIDQFADIAFDTDDNNDEWITDENGNNQELKHSFFFVKLRKMEFNLFDQALETGEMTISMTSGHCGSCNFTIMVDEETQQNTVQVDSNGNLVRDNDGNVITYGTPQPQQQDTTQNEVWIALRKEEDSYGVIMPDTASNLVPIANQDTFVFTNILLPNSYIEDAEQKLEYELLKDLKENNEDKFNFSIDFSRIYLAENPSVLDLINENALVKVRYNGIDNELYTNSYSYKIDSKDALPQIKVELKKNLDVVKNAIMRSEGKIIRYVKEIVYNSQNNAPTSDNKRGGTITQNNAVDVVQTTGGSTTKVMSQKAVTDALKAIDSDNVEVTQYMGQSTEKVMSQKSVTDELQKLASNTTEVVQTTGSSTVKVMSQNATTNAVSSVDKVLPFDGFIDEAEIFNQTNPYGGGKIYFVKSVNRFAYYREQDNIYTALWNGYDKYATIIAGQGVIPNSDRIFVYNTQLYLWDGETLVSVGGDKTEIPPFKGIITRATVINQTGFYKYGEVYFIESPSIDGVAVDNGIFAYKIRDSYYRSWHSVGEYMNTELSEPITDKLFVFNKQHYVYSDNKLELLSNIGKLKWEQF